LYPDRRRRQKIVKRDRYHYLSEEFKAVIDYYCAAEKKRGKKDGVIYGESHNGATFLYTLQEKGIKTIEEITEEAVLSVFILPDGSLRRSGSYKKNIAAVVKASIPREPTIFNQILSFLPKLRDTRKNIQYLSPEEITAIKEVLTDKNSPLSLRDRAVGKLAMNTGLRMCDIAGMTKDSIDWDNDLIFIDQQKTEVPLELPLTAVIGNAVYDYLTQERPKTECEYIFVSEHSNDRRLKSGSLGNISDKIMAAAGIRQARRQKGFSYIPSPAGDGAFRKRRCASCNQQNSWA
jgi:integrase